MGATVTCVGVRMEHSHLVVFALFGLNDIFSMTIRPVKKGMTKEQYEKRAQKWKNKWEKLNIMSWND